MNTTKSQRDRRYWLRLLRFGLVALVVMLLLMLYVIIPLMQAYSWAHPARIPVSAIMGMDAPAVAGEWFGEGGYEDVTLATGDGLELAGWFVPGTNGAAVLLTHGHSNNRVTVLPQGKILHNAGYSVLLFDLRAHGQSEGEIAGMAGKDALAALGHLQRRDEVDPERIGALGLSLGAMEIMVAAAQDEGIQAVVADGVAFGTAADYWPPLALEDWVMLPGLPFFFGPRAMHGVSTPVSITEAAQAMAPRPVLFIAGTLDDVEERQVRRLYELAGEPKEIWEIADAGHTGGWMTHPETYAERITAFFDTALGAE